MNLRSLTILGRKGGESWYRFRQGKFKNHELLKNPLNPFGTKGKVVGKGRFSLIDFLSGVGKSF
jgi:hypothetical protein